jgi:hypothetical protein
MKSRRERELEDLRRLRSETPARPTVSWDEASRCPKCKVQMTAVKQMKSHYNLTATIHILECRNRLCPWGETHERKSVEVMADGTIPVMLPGPKVYDAQQLTPEQQARLDQFYRDQYLQTTRKDEIERQ